MRSLRAGVLLPFAWAVFATSLASCEAVVDVGDYTFEADPCGPRPASCTGGHDLTFLIRRWDVARADGAGHREGVDLDGTSEAVCGQQDFVAPDGRAGVDNAFAPIFEVYEGVAGINLREQTEQSSLMGMGMTLVVLSHVDDPGGDDCIEVTLRDALVPTGMALADLDRDGDGLVDPGLTFDYHSPSDRDATACIVDGTVHARFPALFSTIRGTTIEGTLERQQLRMPFTAAGAPNAVFAGSVHVEDLSARSETPRSGSSRRAPISIPRAAPRTTAPRSRSASCSTWCRPSSARCCTASERERRTARRNRFLRAARDVPRCRDLTA